MALPLPAAQTHLGEVVAEARQSHRPVTISEDDKPVAALINMDDLASLGDHAALAAHLADKAAGIKGPAYAINAHTAMKVTDGSVEVIAEGHWKLFNPAG